MPAVNITGVVAAAVTVFVFGWLWYGPLFGKTWENLSGQKMGSDKSKMPQTMATVFVGALVTAYVLAAFLGLTGTTTLTGAVTVAFWAWLGFQATLKLGVVLWEGKSWNFYFLNAAHDLIGLALMAAVLSLVR